LDSRYAVAEQLAVSLQFSRLISAEKKKTAKELAKGVAKNVKDCLEFRGGLPSATCLPRAKGRQQEGIS